jgi:predicted lipoprotein with Yx(FWY)xxD motif
MTRRKPITFLVSAAVIPLTALAVAACGGGGAATAATAPAKAKTTPTPTPTTAVRVAHSSLGSILVDSQGRTLYLFKADSATKSACTGACATAWPPLLANGKTTAGAGLSASKLGTITRSGGQHQVTYNGHPLYTFVKDTKPGDTTGQGVVAFGAGWFAVSPAGNQISTPKPAAKPATKPAPAPATTPAPAPAPKPTTTPTPPPAPKPASKPAPPVSKPAPPATSGIPQNGGGDDDSDNHGGPSDGDGNV